MYLFVYVFISKTLLYYLHVFILYVFNLNMYLFISLVGSIKFRPTLHPTQGQKLGFPSLETVLVTIVFREFIISSNSGPVPDRVQLKSPKEDKLCTMDKLSVP